MLSLEGVGACAVKCWAEVKSSSRVMKIGLLGWYGLGGLIFFMLMLFGESGATPCQDERATRMREQYMVFFKKMLGGDGRLHCASEARLAGALPGSSFVYLPGFDDQ